MTTTRAAALPPVLPPALPPALTRALTVLTLGALCVGGCFAERRGLSRDGLLKALDDSEAGVPLPTIEELLALRAPPPGGVAPAAALPTSPALARARDAAARGDIAGAEKAWAELSSTRGASIDVVDGQLHRCLIESVLRRTEGVLLACPAFLEKAASDPRALAAVRVLSRTRFSSRTAGDVIAARADAWVAACGKTRANCADLAFVVADERISRAKMTKDADERRASLAASGRVRRVVVEGPFDGEHRSLFAANGRGESLAPFARAPFYDKRTVDDADGAIVPAAGLRDGVHRMTFDVVTKEPVDATLFLSGGRGARIRVDGVVAAERVFDEPSPAVVRSQLALSAGVHRVDALVLVGGRETVTIALLDRQGRPLSATLPLESPSASARKGTVAVKAPPDRDGAVEALLPRAGNADAATLEAILVRQTIARGPAFGVHPDENQELARVLSQQFGWSPVALAVAAEAVGEDRSLPERVSASLAARLWAEVKKTWPTHPVALIAEAREQRDERPDAALATYRALVRAQPRYPFGHRELIDVALDADLVDEAVASAEALLALDESKENIDAALPAFNAAGDAVRVASLLDTRARLDDAWADVSPASARRLLDAGRTEDGLAALGQPALVGGDDPFTRDEWLSLLALLKPSDALRALDQAIAASPRDAALHLKRAQLVAGLADATGGGAAAEARANALRTLVATKALPLLRNDARAMSWLEELGLPPPWLPRFALGDEVISKRFAALNRVPAEPPPFEGHGSVALLDDVERIIEDDEGSIVIRHLIVELRSKEALDRFGEISLDGERLLRLRVIKPSSVHSGDRVEMRPVVIEPERHRGIDDVSLPQLAPGDIVERLSVERDSPSRLGGNFETRTLDGTTTPALSRRYIVSWPEGWAESRGVALLALHGMPEPTQHHVVAADGTPRLVSVFALDDVEATSPEPYAPDRGETARTAGYTWGVDEALWARLRGANLIQASQRDQWLDECARRIAGSGDDEEKLRRVFAFVVRRIEPEGSTDDATAVLAGGKGRRTPLLLALLRGAGLDAAPVALQLPTQAPTSTLDGDSWTIVAVRVRTPQREHFALVDGNAVLDQLPPVARDAKVLDLSPLPAVTPGAQLVSTLPDDVVDDTPVKVQLDLSLAAGGGLLTGLVVVTVPPAKADGARRGARRATQEQLGTVLERSLADTLPGLRVLEVKTPDLDAFGAPLRLGARIEVPLPELVDGTARFEHLFADGASGGLALTAPFSQFLAVADRTLPVLVGAESESLEVQVALPRNAAFVEAPRAADIAAGPFRLVQQVQITDGVLYWRRDMTKNTARIPVERWPAVRATLATIVATADARLSFALPDAAEGTRGERGDVRSSTADPPTSGGSRTDSQKQASVQQNR